MELLGNFAAVRVERETGAFCSEDAFAGGLLVPWRVRLKIGEVCQGERRMYTKQWSNGIWGRSPLFLGILGFLLAATPAPAQEADPSQGAQGAGQMQGQEDGRGRMVGGKITAIKDGALELTRPDGASVTVKLNDKTEYRKDRQSAKLADFKVGDMVFIRAEGAGDEDLTATLVAARTGGPGGQDMGGPSGGVMMGGGELGKDFVFGEVKAVDAQ